MELFNIDVVRWMVWNIPMFLCSGFFFLSCAFYSLHLRTR